MYRLNPPNAILRSLTFGFDDWLGKWSTAHDNLPTGWDPVMNIHERTSQLQRLTLHVHTKLAKFELTVFPICPSVHDKPVFSHSKNRAFPICPPEWMNLKIDGCVLNGNMMLITQY